MQSVLIPKKASSFPKGYKVVSDENSVTYIRGDIGYWLKEKGNYFVLRKFDYLNRKFLDVSLDDKRKFGIGV